MKLFLGLNSLPVTRWRQALVRPAAIHWNCPPTPTTSRTPRTRPALLLSRPGIWSPPPSPGTLARRPTALTTPSCPTRCPLPRTVGPTTCTARYVSGQQILSMNSIFCYEVGQKRFDCGERGALLDIEILLFKSRHS